MVRQDILELHVSVDDALQRAKGAVQPSENCRERLKHAGDISMIQGMKAGVSLDILRRCPAAQFLHYRWMIVQLQSSKAAPPRSPTIRKNDADRGFLPHRGALCEMVREVEKVRAHTNQHVSCVEFQVCFDASVTQAGGSLRLRDWTRGLTRLTEMEQQTSSGAQPGMPDTATAKQALLHRATCVVQREPPVQPACARADSVPAQVREPSGGESPEQCWPKKTCIF